MHLYNVTILLAALASLLTPLSALAIPIERSGEQPDCPALVEVFKVRQMPASISLWPLVAELLPRCRLPRLTTFAASPSLRSTYPRAISPTLSK